MKFQRIDFPVVLQVLLIAVTPVIFSFCLSREELVITRLVLVIAWLTQVIILLRYLSTRDKKFRLAVGLINSGDEYQVFRKREGSGARDEILDEINEAISRFRNLKIEKEADLLFFRLVMEYVSVGIIVVSREETIRLVNRSALELMGIESLNSFKRLDSVKKGLAGRLREIPENGNVLIELDSPGRSARLSVSASEIRVMDVVHRIYSFKDIKQEVDRKELETWHNMLRIISHEVVNSISPITLSSRGMQRNIQELKRALLTDKDSAMLNEVEAGLMAISERGEGLNEFVEKVQKLTRIPEPVTGKTDFNRLVTESAGLMKKELDDHNVKLESALDSITIFCDKTLVVQVLINLIRNSMESFEEGGEKLIKLSAIAKEGHTHIMVEDNGPGIPEELKAQVFSPFFSTKMRGSGLGLSFARQVMNMHRGDITAWSEGGKTVFTLSFPNQAGVRNPDTPV